MNNKLLDANIVMINGAYHLTIQTKYTEAPYTEKNFRADVDNKTFETKQQLLTYLRGNL